MNILQLRSTIFIPQNIGYSPENAEDFKNQLELGDCKIYGIPPVGVVGINPNTPQYGMPWRLFKKTDDGNEYNIAFYPGKIDIILTKNISYNEDIEDDFCKKSIVWLGAILDKTEKHVTRIAYAPLYAFKTIDAGTIWNTLLKSTVYDGIQTQDLNLSFLLKKIIKFGEKDIQMNMLHNFSDGIQTVMENESLKADKVVLFQLDLNSVPEKDLSLDKDGVKSFFKNILEEKNKLVKNVIQQ